MFDVLGVADCSTYRLVRKDLDHDTADLPQHTIRRVLLSKTDDRVRLWRHVGRRLRLFLEAASILSVGFVGILLGKKVKKIDQGCSSSFLSGRKLGRRRARSNEM